MEIKNSPFDADSNIGAIVKEVEEAENRILAEVWSGLVDEGTPLGTFALVEVQPKVVESISAGGLVMPGGLPLRLAKVLKVGPGHWKDGVRVPLDVEVGDRIFIPGRAGIPIDPMHDLRLVTPGDVLYRIPESPPTPPE